MRNRFLTILLAMLAVCAIVFTVACKTPSSQPEEPVENEPKLELSLSSVELEKFEEVTLIATLDNVNATNVEWVTTNQNVATVVNGKVSAVGEGSAVIIVKNESLEARCLVNVTDNGLVPGLTTNIGLIDKLCLIKNDSFKVEYQVTYNNKEVLDAEVTMTLAENDYAELEDDVVVAKAVGDAGTLVINVNWRGLISTVYVDVFVMDNANAKLSDKLSLTLYNDIRGGEIKETLSPKFTAENVELNTNEYTIIEWEYDENVVFVNESTLEVEAVGKGNTDIIATFKANSSNVTVKSVLPVTVNLYDDDKSDTITLDTLYLDRQEYYLDVLEVYADKTSDQLINVEINLITDITGVNTYTVPVKDGKVKIDDVNKLGLTGERKWKIESNRLSYIVKVPTIDIDPATNVLGKYNPAEWDYSMEIVRERNDVKAVFKDKASGLQKDVGYCTFTPWKGNDYKAGKIEIDLKGSKVISNNNILGYYIYDNGCYQMNLSTTGSMLLCPIELYSEGLVAPYATLAGTFTSDNWVNTTFVLYEDKSVVIQSENGDNYGAYVLTPNSFVSGKIVITLETALCGQAVFEGDYSYSKSGAKFSVTVNAESTPVKQFEREGSTDVYAKFANCYTSSPSWCVMRFYENGIFLLDYPYWSQAGTMGTYELNSDGTIKIVLVRAYNNESIYEGTYYVENGVYCIKFNAGTLLNADLIYKPKT